MSGAEELGPKAPPEMEESVSKVSIQTEVLGSKAWFEAVVVGDPVVQSAAAAAAEVSAARSAFQGAFRADSGVVQERFVPRKKAGSRSAVGLADGKAPAPTAA
jgi:hypothetical protein